MDRLKALTDSRIHVSSDNVSPTSQATDNSQNGSSKMEIYTSIQERFVSKNVASEYFQRIYPSMADFWLFRREFSYSFAALTFMTYIMFMNQRYPQKLAIARSSGRVWGSELIPSMNVKAVFANTELVPFRLTPNLQILMGPIAMEGIFSCAIMAIARCLTEQEFGLEQDLSIFVKDEIFFYLTQQHRTAQDPQIREGVQTGSDVIIKRAVALARPPEAPNLPANQTVIDTISEAVNPMRLAQADALWMPYL